jgi:protein-S-isoprenylcysteine O-methyltransferase Ste14
MIPSIIDDKESPRAAVLSRVWPVVREFVLIGLFVWAVTNQSLIGVIGVVGLAVLSVAYNIVRSPDTFLTGCRIMELKMFGRTFDKQPKIIKEVKR